MATEPTLPAAQREYRDWLDALKSRAEALYYVQQTQAQGWSRAMLTHQIESGLWQRQGKALHNFAPLPAPQSVVLPFGICPKP